MRRILLILTLVLGNGCSLKSAVSTSKVEDLKPSKSQDAQNGKNATHVNEELAEQTAIRYRIDLQVTSKSAFKKARAEAKLVFMHFRGVG